ncbi:MAG: ATP-binding protein [Anaerolineae bacterium]
MLIDREKELTELNLLLEEPGAHLLAVSGRRRLGKTTLLLEWARRSGQPYLYWVASRAPAPLLLRQFSQTVWRQVHPDDVVPATFSFDHWADAFEQVARLAADRQYIVILDEFPYAAEADSALPSILQNAWDHHLKATSVVMVLCGSHIGMMERLLRYDAPLYGRMVGPLRVEPLPFRALADFLPSYTAAERVAVWAILGGVPAYLERFDDSQALAANVRRHIFRSTGLFRTDPEHLLHESLREPQNYIAILLAIAAGHHRVTDIVSAAGMSGTKQADPYLARLQELGFIRRELPATVPEAKRATSRLGRYVLADNYLRFYFRFIWPHQGLLEQGLDDRLWELIGEQLHAFVGQAAFEELCREWVLVQARTGGLPFSPDRVGAHWGGGVQVDTVAVNWRERATLLGECKWGVRPVGRNVVRELIEKKAPKVLKRLPGDDADWTVSYAFFARAGFTEAARTETQVHDALLVDLATLDRDLQAVV